MASQQNHDRRKTDEEAADERAVRSIPLDTDAGGQVVIEQQNVGPANQVGGGEFKNAHGEKSPDTAAWEQDALQREAPIDSAVEDDAGADPQADVDERPDELPVDPLAPGRAVIADQFGEDAVEPNEPA
jgi:hypothetical protein